MNRSAQKAMPAWLPFLVGTLLVIQFAGLGVWQISRGLEKRAEREAFNEQAGFTTWSHGTQIRPYQRLEVTGQFDGGRQFLLDNIILDNRFGHYVLTPLMVAEDEPLLIVNRGWIQRTPNGVDSEVLRMEPSRITVRGRAGSLPKAGNRLGAAFSADATWPRHAAFPRLADLAAALGQDVQGFVLLMDPQESQGFLRHWVAEEMGPSRHFGYALQWLTMGAVLAGLLVWHYRRRAFPHD